MLIAACTSAATPGAAPHAGSSAPHAAGSSGASGSSAPGSSAGAGGGGGTTIGTERDAAAPRDAALLADAAAPPSDASVTDAAMPTESPRHAARALAQPPGYMGSVDNSVECSRSYPTVGFEPIGAPGERFPLFLYFAGTAFVMPDPSASHDSPAALAVTEAMARRGYVALSVAYDNGALAWLSDHRGQLACLFEAERAGSLLGAACALPQVDCELGIATWGHSQGGFVGVAAANHDPRVRGAWATGYGGDADVRLSRHRLRVVNGEADTSNGTAATLNAITGLTAADCAPDASVCLRADGSGWIIVRRSELADPASGSADHCWFDKRACLDGQLRLEPSWVDPASQRPYALELNADWLARTARDATLP